MTRTTGAPGQHMAQQLALRLAIARGGDPDKPRGLHTVTETL